LPEGLSAGAPPSRVQPLDQDLRGRAQGQHRPRRSRLPGPASGHQRRAVPRRSAGPRLPRVAPARASPPGLDPQARRRGVRRIRARHRHPQGDRPAAAPLRRGGALRDGAGQRRDDQARGRDRDRPRDPPRARRAARREGEDASRRAVLRRGLPPPARHHPPPGEALLPRGREVHRVPARRVMRARAAILLFGAALACRGPRPAGGPTACTHVQAVRQLRGAPVCEDVWTCARPSGGRFDRVGLHRLAACEGATGPVVVYLPGMHMNGELPVADPRYDLRLYLAAAGVRTWGLDYRTHAVPADATPKDLRALGPWTAEVFTDDAAWAVAFAHSIDAGPLYVAGFS